MNNSVFKKEGDLLVNNKKIGFSITFSDIPSDLVGNDFIDNLCDEIENQVPGLNFSENFSGLDFSNLSCLIVDNNENETRRFVEVISDLTINYHLIDENLLETYLLKKQFDVVFLSINLDWRNSKFKDIFNCREYILRKFGVNIFVVATTEYPISESERLRYKNQGFNAVLEKPVVIKKLLRILYKVIKQNK